MTKGNASKLAKEILKRYNPKGAHLRGVMGGSSEEGQVQAAQKRLSKKMIKNIEVSAPAV